MPGQLPREEGLQGKPQCLRKDGCPDPGPLSPQGARALHSTELQSNTSAHAAAPTRGVSVITTEAHRGPSASVLALYEPLHYEGGSPNNK